MRLRSIRVPRETLTRLSAIASLMWIAALAVACGSHGTPPNNTVPPLTQGACAHALHALVNGKRVDFCAGEGPASATTSNSSAAGRQTTGRAARIGPPLPSGVSSGVQPLDFTFNGADGEPTSVSGLDGEQVLLFLATATCESENKVFHITAPGADDLPALAWSGSPSDLWRQESCQSTTCSGLGQDWFYFANAPHSCDQVLAREEILSCVADKFKAIADGPTTNTWTWTQTANGLRQLQFTFPPQATADRFIARDLAVYALSTLALDDLTQVPLPSRGGALSGETCAELYRDAAAGTLDPGDVYAVFQSPTFDTATCTFESDRQCTGAEPAPVSNMYFQPAYDPNLVQAAVDARLTAEAGEIKTASELLEELTRDAVNADIGAAQQKRARATDPRAGNEKAWGVAPNDPDNNFDTLAHVARVLYGRNDYNLGPFTDSWDFTPIGANPTALYDHPGSPVVSSWPIPAGTTCQVGTGTDNVLQSAYGPDLSARTEDVPATTNAQRSLAELVETRGIVIPRSALSGDLTAVRQAIGAQLVTSEAITSGNTTTDSNGHIVVNPNFAQDPRAVALQNLIADAADGDLRWALSRTYDLYRLLTNTADGATSIAADPTGNTSAGLRPAVYVSSAITALGGVVIKGGLPRNDLAADFTARAGSMESASVCDLGEFLEPVAYQDAFSLGQVLYRRMFTIDQVGKQVSLTDLTSMTEPAKSEIRAWVGPGWVTVSRNDFAPPFGLDVDAEGIAPGASSFSIVLVYGQPWHADCVAGLRSSCPDDLSTHVVQPNAGSVTITPSTVSDGMSYGAAYSNWPANFTPTYSGANPAPNLIYIVVPAQGSQPGSVLGAIPLRTNTPGSEVIAVSDLRRRLLNGAMGFGPQGATQLSANCGGQIVADSRVGESPNLCLDGVPRQMFVPLANDLTSSNPSDYENSWEHYLTLAQTAAANADMLGQQLLDVGLQQSMQMQQGQEELGKICGTYSSLNPQDVQTQNGAIVPTKDANLAACLDEPTTPIVGLGPPDALTVQSVSVALGCLDRSNNPGPAAGSPICTSLQNPNPPTTPIIQLNLLHSAPAAAQTTGTGDPCADIVAAATTMNASRTTSAGQNYDRLIQSMTEPFASATQIGAVAQSLQLRVDTSMNWTLLAQGTPVMDSRASFPPSSPDAGAPATNTNLWPGCLLNGVVNGAICGDSTCPFDSSGNACLAETYDLIFRDTTGAGNLSAPSGDEMKLILWRLEGALWLMGAAGGGVPEGMFDLWIPAVNFSASATTNAPLPTIYGDGTFCVSGKDANGNSLYRLCPSSTTVPLNTDDLRDQVGTAQTNTSITMPTGPLPGVTATAVAEIPQWIAAAYNDPAHFVLVHATNAAFGPTTLQMQTHHLGDFGGGFGFFGWPLASAHGQGLEFNPYSPSDNTFNGNSEDGRPGDYAVWVSPSPLFGSIANPSAMYIPIDFADGAKRMAARSITGLSGGGETFNEDLRNWKTLSWPGSAIWAQVLAPNDAGVPQPQNVIDITTTSVSEYPRANIHFPIGPGNDVASVETFTFHAGGVPTSTLFPQPTVALQQSNIGYQATWAPSRVVQLFVNSYAPAGDPNGTTAQIVQALTLACKLQPSQVVPHLNDPPVLTNISQLPVYESWLSHQTDLITQTASTLFLQDVPTSVVKDFQTGQQQAGSAGGDHGVLLQKIEADMNQLSRTADGIVGNVQGLSLAYNTLGTQIDIAGIQTDIALSNITVEKIQSDIDITNAIVGAVVSAMNSVGNITGDISGTAATAATASLLGAAVVTGLELGKQDVLNNEADQQEQLRQAQVGSALATFNTTTSQLFTSIRQSMDELNSEVSDARATLAQLHNDEEDAQYQVGKASGADFVRDSNGAVLPLSVNTVLRREYDVDNQRYQLALDNAKYLAHLARLSIEQRLGIRLDEITSQVGALDPPSVWADDLCNLSGVDYKTLRTFDIPDGGASTQSSSSSSGPDPEQQLVAQFADQFIGDYVQKLADFVQYYNIAHPAHQGTDTSVLSLQQDLLPPKGVCFQDAPNMLYYSGNLKLSESVGGTVLGWVDPACAPGAAVCAQVVPATAIDPNLQGPTTGPTAADATWLSSSLTSSGTADASAPPFGQGVPPPNTVWQQLSLQPGSYLLSWWDQARKPDGSAASAMTTASAYQVGVFDSNWLPVKLVPYTASFGWSNRNELEIDIANPGTYSVAISPSAANGAASLLVAGMQFEFTANPGAGPTPYIGTNGARQYAVPGCRTYTAADVQAAFAHKCGPDGKCYYELTTPFHIDTTDLVGPGSPPTSKFAAGNFNYRDINVAVNLVGTGVRDCSQSPTPDCFGTGYIEYSLVHDASEVNVLNAFNNAECFNFGSASINHGKALAAERYITLPIGSADQQLLNQDSIQKIEFQGRPLDGNYKLRIWDSPALNWGNLQDVQFVVQYLYWSPVDTQP